MFACDLSFIAQKIRVDANLKIQPYWLAAAFIFYTA